MSSGDATIRLLVDDVRRRIDTGSECLKEQRLAQAIQHVHWAGESLNAAGELVAVSGSRQQHEFLSLLRKDLTLLNQQIQLRKSGGSQAAEELEDADPHVSTERVDLHQPGN